MPIVSALRLCQCTEIRSRPPEKTLSTATDEPSSCLVAATKASDMMTHLGWKEYLEQAVQDEEIAAAEKPTTKLDQWIYLPVVSS